MFHIMIVLQQTHILDTKEDTFIINIYSREANVMSRKPLSIWEQENKKEFDRKLKEYSTECLKQIYYIATKGLDMRTRLLANEYIVDRCFGKDYRAYKEDIAEQNMSNITINLLPTGKTCEQNIKDEQEIWEIENSNVIDDDIDDLSDDWGKNDIYNGKK